MAKTLTKFRLETPRVETLYFLAKGQNFADPIRCVVVDVFNDKRRLGSLVVSKDEFLRLYFERSAPRKRRRVAKRD